MFVRAKSKGTGAEKRRGFVLIAVLVVITLLTLAAYQYSQMTLSEYKAADAARRAVQARALADSGLHYAMALLSSSDNVQNILNGNPWNNASAFQGIVVRDSEQARSRGRFSIVALFDPDQSASGVAGTNQGFWYGVMDESAKINLQTLMRIDSSGQTAYNALMKLPNMTDDVANSILDWIDPNTTLPRSSGAKDQYYSTLSPPYHCKNGPLDSMEELMLVKGMSVQLLFGNDRNRNGMLDPDENDGSGLVDRGLSGYLTIYTRELNVDSNGNPRIFINDSDLQTLYSNLQNAVGDDLANYIIAYRQYGPANQSSSGGGAGGAAGGQARGAAGGAGGAGAGGAAAGGAAAGGGAVVIRADGSQVVTARTTTGGQAAGAGAAAGGGQAGGGQAGGGTNRLSRNQLNFQNGQNANSISSLYALINSSVSIPSSTQGGQPTVYPSPMSDPASIRQLFPMLYDSVTTQTNGQLPGRVNVNTAPSAVLSALPGFSDSDVQAILSHRPDPTSTQAPDAIFNTPAWLLTEANISSSTLQTVDRYITARTQVYRLQSIGYFDGGGPSARIEAVIDTNAGRPRIIYWRDLTELGKGFDLTGSP
jgi:type II secretory pathway component PulK